MSISLSGLRRIGGGLYLAAPPPPPSPLALSWRRFFCVESQIFPPGQEEQLSLILCCIFFETLSGLLTMGWSQWLHAAAPTLLLCSVCLSPPSVLRNGLGALRGPLSGWQMSSVLPSSPRGSEQAP